jgi:hypothetical protein
MFPRYPFEERIDFEIIISKNTLGGWNGNP